jgi:nucleoside-diphosphate-sugar epimerase
MRVVVTGATGFLGGATARRLARAGHDVLGTGRALDAGARLEADGVGFRAADVRDAAAVRELCQGAEAVVHCAALSSPWGRASEFEGVNRRGTEHVVQACRAHGVRRLVHVSTPGIYFGFRDRRDVAETDALPRRPANDYVRTKLAAERVVERAHGEGLDTVTLRPRAIYGPGDTVVLPRLIRALEAGRLPRIGDGRTVMDLTYIDNATQAVELALGAAADVSGRAYNVTDGQPVALWPLVDDLCARLDLPPPRRSVRYGVVAAYAVALEALHRTLLRGSEPLLTRYSAALLAHSLTLDITAARRDLGYAPSVAPDEGLARFVDWWRAAR